MSDIISIIIPIYNTEKYLVESLESISNQTYKNIEILLINDGSSDNSKVICEKYCNIDKRFKYFENTNHGVSYSRNFGIKKSSGKYLVFVDSDDVIAKNFIELLYNNLINNMADCSICGIKGFNLSAEIEESSTIGDTYLEQELFINLFNKYGG
ncbi:MAG: glycosyltransferase family 2 protein, partial [Clostridium celatum]|nr:glycosyltransferase family 2 protein [Clostridium celatum]